MLTSPRLTPQVLISMVYLPDVMPASFQATYTPVESAGTDAQIKHLARLMATQMTAAGIGPGQKHNLTRMRMLRVLINNTRSRLCNFSLKLKQKMLLSVFISFTHLGKVRFWMRKSKFTLY